MSTKKQTELLEKIAELEKTNKILLEQFELLVNSKKSKEDLSGELEAVAVVKIEGVWSFVKVPFSISEVEDQIKTYTAHYGVQKSADYPLYHAKEHLIFKARGLR
jgi:hypothetical protein